MTFMFEINAAVNPILTVIPVLLMSFSGYSIGVIISHLLGSETTFLKKLLYGNLALNFLFISGFIFFGVLIYAANIYFMIFTFILIGLTIIGIWHLFRKFWSTGRKELGNYFSIRSWSNLLKDSQNILILLGISIFTILVVYQGIIIYSHSIFSGEFDSIYLFLPISKSILLGNGLNHDFYLGEDSNIRFPPFTQALNAWLIHSFSYSSLKLFPIYFVFFTALVVYYFAQSITRNKILGLISSLLFLITPVLFIMSSNYSLQEDLAFVFFLASSFYLLSEIIRFNKIEKIHLLVLSLCLAIMPLSREIGIIISISLFFLFPVIKFTQNNPTLRGIFTFLSLIPLYGLSFYDMLSHGLTFSVTIRFIILLIANLAIYYISSQVKNQSTFSTLLRGQFKYYFLPLVIPIIFLTINIIIINGPYSVFSFDPQFAKDISNYRQIMEKANPIAADLKESLAYVPQIQLLFLSIALGAIFLIFKIRGYIILIDELKKNPQYAIMLIFTALVIVIWSYLLGSGIEGQSNRHLLYILPLFSVITVIGMKRKEDISYQLYYYGVVTFALFYYIFYYLYIYSWNNNFGGMALNYPIMNWTDVLVAFAIISPLLIFELNDRLKIFRISKKPFIYKIVGTICAALLVTNIAILVNSGVALTPIEVTDTTPPDWWEGYVVEVVNYLYKNPDNKSVFSIHAPAIPFFTNRTNYDGYMPRTYSSISQLLSINDPITLENKMDSMNIGYIVIPNDWNTALYKYTQNTMNYSKLLQIIKTDPNFERIGLPHFDIYKYRDS